MERIVLDGKCMASRKQAHAHIAEKLSFPEYYGANLDALWDCLGDMPECEILLINTSDMLLALGEYGKRLLNTFIEAALEHPKLSFESE